MAKRSNSFIVNLKETVKENGRLLTVFAVAAIIIGGITLVQYPQNWWIALLAVTGFFVALFLFINARGFLKLVFSVGLTILLAGIAFNLGLMIEPQGTGSFVWLFGHVILFLLCLSVSYFVPSGQSRWSGISLAVIVYFSATWLAIGLMGTVLLPALVNIALSLGVFLLYYSFGGKTRFSAKNMPKHYESPELTSRLMKASESAGLNVQEMKTKDETTYLLWGERSYVIYPVAMDQAFGLIGRKKSKLSYGGKTLNPWLRYLSFTRNPYYKARGAETMLVLLDTKNANGKEPKIIGITLPDSKAVAAVGVFPGKLLLTDEPKALEKALLALDPTFEEYTLDLTEKQKIALSKIGEAGGKIQE